MELRFTPGTDPQVAVTEASSRGLLLAAEHVLQQSNRTIPHERGDLQRSGKASISDDGTEAAVSYDTPYAVPVHEVLAAKHDDGRRAKWLELTMHEEVDAVRNIIVQAIKGAL